MLESLAAVDMSLLHGILALPRPIGLEWLMIGASALGMAGGLWLIIGALLAVFRTIPFRDFVRLALAIALVHLVVDVVLKPWIDRPRPPHAIAGLVVAVDVPESRSFPSGHAANAMAGALVLTRVQRRWRALLWTAAVIVAVARVYLGIHYPFDALAGGAIGLACGWAMLSWGGQGPPVPATSR